MGLSNKADSLIKKYIKKYNKRPRGWNWEEETMKEYEKYLEKELNKDN